VFGAVGTQSPRRDRLRGRAVYQHGVRSVRGLSGTGV